MVPSISPYIKKLIVLPVPASPEPSPQGRVDVRASFARTDG